MVNFSVDQVRAIMDLKQNIRSMSVIAHVDHGKSTLTDVLVQKAGIFLAKAAGDARCTDTHPEEARRGITIKSTGITMYFEYDKGGDVALTLSEEEVTSLAQTIAEKNRTEANIQISENSYLINLIDSPGHADFSSEVTAALRVTDGALVVVDAVDGVCVQTETVLRQALGERVKPVLMVNKVDRALLELQLPPEELYQSLRRAVESVNAIIATYNDDALGDVQVDPVKGTVAFGSALQQWAFTLRRFAKSYVSKFGIAEDKLLPKLWGDWFYDPARKAWTSSNANGNLERGFCQFVATPIISMFEAIMQEKQGKVNKLLKSIGIELKGEDKALTGKQLLKKVMKKWINAGDVIFEMIVLHLPSPVVAQKYRVDTLYNGPLDDKTATAIRNCDTSENAPLCMYISKMVPALDRGRFYAFGRVFSGTIASGQKVRILGPNYVAGKKTDLWVKNVQRTVIMMGRFVEQVASVPAGNTCALVGVDQYLLKSGTIVTEEDAHTIKTMQFSVSPIVRCAVEPKTSADLPKLIEGLKRLAKSDPMVLCYTEETGEHIIAGASELHLEICLRDLQEDFMGVEVKVSDPIVTFRETCTAKSSLTCLSKSTNKHNRLFVEAEPLGPELCKAIDDGEVVAGTEAKALGRQLADDFGWNVTEARKIWAFGPDERGPNVFVDATKGVDYLLQAKESIVGGFSWATQKGPLCDEPMRGCRFNLMDVALHSDAAHRGLGQIMPTARRVCFSSMLAASPCILEPVYRYYISVPQDTVSNVYSVFTRRRGHVFAEEIKPGNPLVTLSAYLPVMESFGLTEALRCSTGGKAFPQCSFDHWELLGGSPYETGRTNEMILNVRRRKGLVGAIPDLDTYLDRL